MKRALRRLFFRPCGRIIEVGERFAYMLPYDKYYASLCAECGRRYDAPTSAFEYEAAKRVPCGMTWESHVEHYARRSVT